MFCLRPALALFVVVLLSAVARAQTPLPPSSPVQYGRPDSRGQYGSAQPVELTEVAYNPDNYQRRNVIVRGYMSLLPGDVWAVGDGGATLLLVPVPELSAVDLRQLLGRRVEVTGVVRILPTRQGTCENGRRPASACDDPALPPIPDSRPEWPKGSITATGLLDLTDQRGPETGRPAASLSGILTDPAALAGKTVRVVGRFRGANLFGDLPAETRRAPGDWVLQDGEQALWVTGRPPRGKGFDLDPANKADTGRWLEVHGKIEVVGPVGYLKASRIQIVARPAPPSEDQP